MRHYRQPDVLAATIGRRAGVRHDRRANAVILHQRGVFSVRLPAQQHPRIFRPAVLADVAQRLLNDADNFQLPLLRNIHLPPLRLKKQRNLRFAAKARDHRLDGRVQAAGVNGPAKITDQTAQFGVGLFEQVLDIFQLPPRRLFLLLVQKVIENPHLKTQPGDGLRQRIVQFIGEVGALPHPREPRRFLVQVNSFEGQADVAAQGIQQLAELVGQRKALGGKPNVAFTVGFFAQPQGDFDAFTAAVVVVIAAIPGGHRSRVFGFVIALIIVTVEAVKLNAARLQHFRHGPEGPPKQLIGGGVVAEIPGNVIQQAHDVGLGFEAGALLQQLPVL